MNNKLTLALLSAAVATTTHATAGMIAYEGFNYPPGTDLNTQTQPVEFTQWAPGKTPGYTPASGSLSYTSGGTLATSGNSLSGGNIWQSTGVAFNFSDSAWDSFKVKVDNQYAKNSPGASSILIGEDGTTMYVSFLMQSNTHEASFGLHTDSFSASEPFSQMTVGVAVQVTARGDVSLRVKSYKDGTTFDEPIASGTDGASDASRAVQDATGLTADAGSTNFYVLKIEFGADNDKVSLFINPAVGGAEPGTASASITTEGNLVFSALGTFLGHTAGYGQLDEIRFGDTWADVTPAAALKK